MADFTQEMEKNIISMGETENTDTITERLTNSTLRISVTNIPSRNMPSFLLPDPQKPPSNSKTMEIKSNALVE